MDRNSKILFEEILQETASVGLFWFSKDYQKIIEVQGGRMVNNSDLMKSDRIDPIGVHAEYDMPRDQPRGRIMYIENIFRINVGEDCEIDDFTIINITKNTFGLKNLNNSKFKVIRHYHLNTENEI
jgi:hypothetical protein